MRVVSCVPSLSEWIAYLNKDCLVGRTRYCIYPAEIESVPVVGGTKKIVANRIRKLNPDLVISVEEENVKEQIEFIAKEFPVLNFRISDVETALSALERIGDRIAPEKAKQEVTRLRSLYHGSYPGEIQTLYLIWQKPWMGVGNGTFIHSMMEHMGFSNVLADGFRYPILDESDLKRLSPKLVLLPDEPYPFKSSDVRLLEGYFPDARIMLVDGSMFSWYSQRMALFPAYAKDILKLAFSS